MKIGTKSVLYGVHCFLLHPIFVFWAWWRLYGFPFDPRLWIAFFVHDLGYWGKANMDGDEGERHVEFGAKVMGIFGKKWHDFSLYHSRFYAKKYNANYSKLCVADKLAITLEPTWLYLLRANLTGEINEYMAAAKNNDGKYVTMNLSTKNQKKWFADVCDYLRAWSYEHKEIKIDTWTPEIEVSK